jgi:hypothetical protein
MIQASKITRRVLRKISHRMFKKLKKQNGEKFARTLRNFHNGLLEIPDLDVIVRHAGRDAEPLLPYLMAVLASNDDTHAPDSQPADPFALLDQAGYVAFYADTLERQNSIVRYFAEGELLCTFNDSARHEKYHIVHAVKKDADEIKREHFYGREERQDEYGISVISLQMLKTGGFISIKNRYNHAVAGCDNTFDSNPDNIVPGLSSALKTYFNVEFSTFRTALPENYVLVGNQIFKSNWEMNNFYYGEQAWVQNGQIHRIDLSAGDALFNCHLFDNKTKMFQNIDPNLRDSFADDFNRAYGGNKSLSVQNGNLMLNGEMLIEADRSYVKTSYTRELVSTGPQVLFGMPRFTIMRNGHNRASIPMMDVDLSGLMP